MSITDFTSLPEPAALRGRQEHRLSWFLAEGSVCFDLECLHEPVAAPYICDGEFFKDDEGVFPESFKGRKTPLHDGVIESWWTGSDEDSEIWWHYAPEGTESAPGA